MHIQRFSIAMLVGFVLLVSGCANKHTTASTPKVPQVSFSDTMNIVSQSADAAYNTVAMACDVGKMSRSDCLIASKVATAFATTMKQIILEEKSTDDWPTQKTKIVSLLKNAGISAALTNVSPDARNILQAVLTAYNTVSVLVGGPTL